MGDVQTNHRLRPFCVASKHKHLLDSLPAQCLLNPDSGKVRKNQEEYAMSRSFYVDSLIIKDSSVRPAPVLNDHGQDFLIPISVHSPTMMSVSGPVCPSRKTGTFCVCPLCVTTHIHSSRSGIPLLKSQFPNGDPQYCQRINQQSNPGLGHPPVCTPTYSVADPRRYHCLSVGKFGKGTLLY